MASTSPAITGNKPARADVTASPANSPFSLSCASRGLLFRAIGERQFFLRDAGRAHARDRCCYELA